MESKILQAKDDIINCVNAELNQGVPASALVLILESIIPNVEKIALERVEKEREIERQQLFQENNKIEEAQVNN